MEIYINQDYQRNRYDFYFLHRSLSGRVFFSYDKEGNLTETAISDAELLQADVIKPLITMPFLLAEAFISNIADYAKNNGISVKEQSNNEGKLQIMQQHNEFLQSNVQKLIDHLITKK